MPAVALRTLAGDDIPFADVDMTRTDDLFGLPPAEIAAIINSQSDRNDVNSSMVTASQAEAGAREAYLKDFFDYSLIPARQMKAMLGTMRHAVVNVDHGSIVVEKRYVSRCGRFSAKVDTYVPATATIRDAKFVGTYKVLMILKNGIEKEGKGYLYQLNLAAHIIRECGEPVERLLLDFRPSDCGKAEKRELADKYGIDYTGETPITVEVPIIDRVAAFEPYEALWAAKQRAIQSGEVPDFCTTAQTWGGKKCQMGYCPVADLCLSKATEAGTEHPYLKSNSKENAA